MPKQRRRRQRDEGAARRAAGRFAPGAGHWEVVFETRDEKEWHAHLRRLRGTEQGFDWSATRVDTFCGRLEQPTTYRLSVFVER